jgi:integrase
MSVGLALRLVVRGSMRQRGKDAWELRVYRGVDPDTGHQRWATRTVHGSRRNAARELVRFAAETGYARLRAGSVADLLARWFAAASPHWAAPTGRQTRSVIDRHLIPHLGHLPVTKLTAADIDDLYAHLLRAGGREARPLAPGTVHRIHVVLHRALAQAVRWEWIWLNPAGGASPPRIEPPEIRPPTAEQVGTLLDSVRGTEPALFTYLRLAVSTGARRSQLLALRWGDLDLERGAIAFTRALVEGPNGPELRPTKTRRAYRVALDAETLAVLVDHRIRVPPHATTPIGERFVFSLGGNGVRPWRPNFVTKRFIDARRAGRPRPLPLARPAPLHGHADAGRRGADRDRFTAAQPCSRLDHAQCVRPRHPRRRPPGSRDARGHPRRRTADPVRFGHGTVTTGPTRCSRVGAPLTARDPASTAFDRAWSPSETPTAVRDASGNGEADRSGRDDDDGNRVGAGDASCRRRRAPQRSWRVPL